MQNEESKNCFFAPLKIQYAINIICTKIRIGTAKLRTEISGKDFGCINGIAMLSKSNTANTLFIKNIILFKRDNFFNALYFGYSFPILNKKSFSCWDNAS